MLFHGVSNMISLPLLFYPNISILLISSAVIIGCTVSPFVLSCCPCCSVDTGALGTHYMRPDVALPGLAKFFMEASEEESEHANLFIKYNLIRGGHVTFSDIKLPAVDTSSPLASVQTALQLERDVNQAIINLHAKADEHNDAQLTDFLEGTFLNEQVEAIAELNAMIAQMKRVGDGHGLWAFDKELAEGELTFKHSPFE